MDAPITTLITLVDGDNGVERDSFLYKQLPFGEVSNETLLRTLSGYKHVVFINTAKQMRLRNVFKNYLRCLMKLSKTKECFFFRYSLSGFPASFFF